MRRRLLACLVGVSLCLPGPAHAQDVPLPMILARAAEYAARFLEGFSNVVTEERYEQEFTPGVMANSRQRRVLRSDLLFIKVGNTFDWTELRDVFEVDNKEVRDRQARLLKLFEESKGPTQSQTRRILEESARYNLGPARTTNTPVFSILFLTRSAQPRFAFTLGSRDQSVGDRVWMVRYEEQVRPTIVKSYKNEDRPVTGRFWIDADSGCVLKSEMSIEFSGNKWLLATDFKVDERFGLAMPTEMRERLAVDFSLATGTATYGRFRTFGVTTGEVVADEKK